MIAQQSMFWKLFLIEDTLPSCDWTILDSTRVVGDYQCRLARGFHPISTREIYVWFTDEIPVQDGPDIYWGLPGLILEISNGERVMICTKVELNLDESMAVEVPSKGKKVTKDEFDKIMKEHTHKMSKMYGGGKKKGKHGSSISISIDN